MARVKGATVTKKHFEKAAAIVRDSGHSAKIKTIMANSFADLFQSEHGVHFNRARFYVACGVLGHWNPEASFPESK